MELEGLHVVILAGEGVEDLEYWVTVMRLREAGARVTSAGLAPATVRGKNGLAVPVDVEVKIYTVAGRMIHSLPAYAVDGRFVKVEWDGRDREGDTVANGVYLYKIVARTLDGKYSGEALGKLSVAR